jgi:hypothetical protein
MEDRLCEEKPTRAETRSRSGKVERGDSSVLGFGAYRGRALMCRYCAVPYLAKPKCRTYQWNLSKSVALAMRRDPENEWDDINDKLQEYK